MVIGISGEKDSERVAAARGWTAGGGERRGQLEERVDERGGDDRLVDRFDRDNGPAFRVDP